MGGTVSNNSSSTDGSNIELEKTNNNLMTDNITSPKFTYVPSIKYKIVSGLNSTKVMDIVSNGTANKTNIQLYESGSTTAQQWYFSFDIVASGIVYYRMTGVNSGKCIDVASNATSDSTNVDIYTCNNTDAQRFYFVAAGNGYYYIKHKTSNKCLDVSNGSATNGANVQIYTCNSSNAQKWKFASVS